MLCIIYLLDIQLSDRHVGRLIAASSEVECQVCFNNYNKLLYYEYID